MSKEKLTSQLKPGEFIQMREEIFIVLDNVSRETRVELFITRADIDDGRVLIIPLPFAWISTVEHPEMPHHAAMLPG